MQYEVKVFREPEGVSYIALDAVSQEAASRQAAEKGYAVLSAKPLKKWTTLTLRRPRKFPLLLLSQELLALLDAGLTLVEAFETLAEKEADSQTKQVLDQIIAQLYAGQPLSNALETFPDRFPPLYVATMRASERTGNIGDSLGRYVAYQEQIERVKKKVASALIYPVLLLSIGVLVTVFLMSYVVPKFSRIYVDRAMDVPFFSRLLMQWGLFIEAHGWLALMITAGVLIGLGYALTRPETRSALSNAFWKLPAAGERMHVYQLSRLYRTLGMLLRGGTPIATALTLVPGLLSPGLRQGLAAAIQSIKEGHQISQAMLAHGLTTPVAVRLLRVGEQTGKMGEMMERIAGFYDDEIARWVDVFTKTFEPLLMALIGLIIGGVVILMYLPIFELAGSIK